MSSGQDGFMTVQSCTARGGEVMVCGFRWGKDRRCVHLVSLALYFDFDVTRPTSFSHEHQVLDSLELHVKHPLALWPLQDGWLGHLPAYRVSDEPADSNVPW